MMHIVNDTKDGRGEDVLVLMSTYNGARWLREQLDSVLQQKGVKVTLLVRDDGSTDETVSILEEYAKRNNNMSFYTGQNMGVIDSFNDLMTNKSLESHEFVAFCDQDDVWLPYKLARAVRKLPLSADIPYLYCGQLQVVDQALRPIRLLYAKRPRFDIYTAWVQSCATGCTEVFNRRAVELYREGIGSRMEMHDYWMFLVCLYMGKVVWDSEPMILYRQHDTNVVGVRNSSIRSALGNLSQMGRREQMAQDFDKVYGRCIGTESRRVLMPLINCRQSFMSRAWLFADPKYHGYSMKVTGNFKVRSLIGRVY